MVYFGGFIVQVTALDFLGHRSWKWSISRVLRVLGSFLGFGKGRFWGSILVCTCVATRCCTCAHVKVVGVGEEDNCAHLCAHVCN
jgi:hypothetical protein